MVVVAGMAVAEGVVTVEVESNTDKPLLLLLSKDSFHLR